MKDLRYLEKIMNLKTKKQLYENYFCWLYPFTNENINGYYSKIDFKDKKVLTVTASGDHALNALLLGAKHIETFDINPLAKYFSELKVSGIKSLTLEEFLLYFYNRGFKKNKHFLNQEIYFNKLRDNLNIEYKKFWDYIFTNYTDEKIYKSRLFTEDFLDLKALLIANKYLKNNNYNKLKEILKDREIIYHDMNLRELDLLYKIFDIIILSNIPAFLDNIFTKDKLISLKKILNRLTNDESIIVLNYYYNNLMTYKNNKNIIYNIEKVNEVFSDKEYEYLYFESSDILSKNNIIKNLYNFEDKVLITKQKTLSKKT